MGRMKEVYMYLMELYDGNIPDDLTIEDAQKLIAQSKINWKAYESAKRDRDRMEFMLTEFDNKEEERKQIQENQKNSKKTDKTQNK